MSESGCQLFVHHGFPENIGFGRVTRLRAPPGHGGAGRCYRIFSGIDPPRGRPTGAAALILLEKREGGIYNILKTFSNDLTGKSIVFRKVTRLRASPRYGGAGGFRSSFVTSPPRGYPTGAAALIIRQNSEGGICWIIKPDLISNNKWTSEIPLSPACIPHVMAKFAFKK